MWTFLLWEDSFSVWVFVGLFVILVWGKFVQQLLTEKPIAKVDTDIARINSKGTSRRALWAAHFGYFAYRIPRTLLVISLQNAGSIIITASIFSFLFIFIRSFLWGSVGDPSYSISWGVLARYSLFNWYATGIWWTAMFQGIAIVLTVLSLNFLGVWLRERLGPPLSHREDGVAEAAA